MVGSVGGGGGGSGGARELDSIRPRISQPGGVVVQRTDATALGVS